MEKVGVQKVSNLIRADATYENKLLLCSVSCDILHIVECMYLYKTLVKVLYDYFNFNSFLQHVLSFY